MRNDREKIKRAIGESFAYLDERPSLEARIMNNLDAQKTPRRKVSMTLVIAIALILALSVAAYAEYRWQVLSRFSFFVGENPVKAGEIMQSGLHSQTFGDVTITVEEAGYDGRTLFLTYSYKAADDSTVYNEDNAYDFFGKHDAGWWWDGMWINGKTVDMALGSTSEVMPGDEPGEVVEVDMWCLANEGVIMDDVTRIALPVGTDQDAMTLYMNPAMRDENGGLKEPAEGVLVFELDTKEIQERITVVHPGEVTELELVNAYVEEAVFTPLMTYIDVRYTLKDGVMEAYIEANGEGVYNDDGKLVIPYGPYDAAGWWMHTLVLVDAQGNRVGGQLTPYDGYGDKGVTLWMPYVEDLPQELFLVQSDGGAADMSRAIRVR